jgi:hypothetical protein
LLALPPNAIEAALWRGDLDGDGEVDAGAGIYCSINP